MGMGRWVRRRDRGRPLTPGQPPCPQPSRPLLKLFPLPRPSLAPALPDPVHQGGLKCHLLRKEAYSEPMHHPSSYYALGSCVHVWVIVTAAYT